MQCVTFLRQQEQMRPLLFSPHISCSAPHPVSQSVCMCAAATHIHTHKVWLRQLANTLTLLSMAETSSQAQAAFRCPLKVIICGWAENVTDFVSALWQFMFLTWLICISKRCHARQTNHSTLATNQRHEVEQVANRPDLDAERWTYLQQSCVYIPHCKEQCIPKESQLHEFKWQEAFCLKHLEKKNWHLLNSCFSWNRVKALKQCVLHMQNEKDYMNML